MDLIRKSLGLQLCYHYAQEGDRIKAGKRRSILRCTRREEAEKENDIERSERKINRKRNIHLVIGQSCEVSHMVEDMRDQTLMLLASWIEWRLSRKQI